MLVERLVGLPEALHVERDHPVLARQRRHDVPPGEQRSSEAVQKDQRRAVAGLLGIERSRRAARHLERDAVAGAGCSARVKRAEACEQQAAQQDAEQHVENRRTHTPNHVAD